MRGSPLTDRIHLTVERSPEKVRVTVSDPGPGFGEPRGAGLPDSSAGWGLELVEHLAERWGHEREPGRSRVCFETATDGDTEDLPGRQPTRRWT